MASKIIASMMPGEPAQYLGSQPTDSTTTKTALSGKPTHNRHSTDKPWGPSSEARHFMGRKNLVPWRELLVNPARKDNALANGGSPKTLGVRMN